MIGILLLSSILIQTMQSVIISTSTVCDDGFYQKRWPNGSEVCLPCRQCPVDRIETRTCADGHNTICSCPEGKYLFKGQCRSCKKCRPGSGVTQKCQGENNTICQPCVRGAFSAKKSHVTPCQQCRLCQPHEERIRKCTSTRDAVCGDCKKGYFRSTYLNQCWKCSYCYPEYPNITAIVPECVRNGGKSLYICMPLERPPFGFDQGRGEFIDSVSVSPNVKNFTVTLLPQTESLQFDVILIGFVITVFVLLVGICIVFNTFKSKRSRHLKGSVLDQKKIGNPDNEDEEHCMATRDSASSWPMTNIATEMQLGNMSINRMWNHVSQKSPTCEEHDNVVLELSTQEPLLGTRRINKVQLESLPCENLEKIQTSPEYRSGKVGFPAPRTARCPLRSFQHCL